MTRWLRRIQISNLGPLQDFDITLSESGVDEIEEPSQWGKSNIFAAICFCLWGCAPDGSAFDLTSITTGEKKCTVRLTTTRGTVYERTITKSRSVTRSIQHADKAKLPYNGREEDFAKALMALGRKSGKVTTGRMVLVPMAWRALTATGKGRPLRNFFVGELVKEGSLRGHVEQLMPIGAALLDADPLDTPAVEEMRKVAKKTASRLEGKAEQAQDALANIAPAVEPPSAPDVFAAKQVGRVAAYWVDRDKLTAARDYKQGEKRRWQLRLDAIPLGPPDYDASKRAGAVDDLDIAQRQLKDCKRERRAMSDAAEQETAMQAGVELRTAEGRVEMDAASTGECPTCGRKQTKAKATARTKALGRDVADCQEVHEACIIKLTAKAVLMHEANAKVTAAETKVERKREALAAYDAGHRRLERLADLGNAPIVPAPPGEAKHHRPEAIDVVAAVRLLAKAGATNAVADERENTRSTAKAAADFAEIKSKEAAASLSRIESLLIAVRQAPSVALKAALAPLCVDGLQLVLAGSGCEVRVDGYSWEGVSDGRQVAADASFRGALRVACKMQWLLMAIDNRGAWSYELPEAVEGGPLLVLRTSPPAVEVT
jgi:hypothetical protein